MAAFVIRQIRAGEETVRRELLASVTPELRRTYRPQANTDHCGGEPGGVLVAWQGGMLVGTAEYVRRDDQLYVQGVAVHQAHRGRGICRALLHAAEEVARQERLPALALCVIGETGNVEIFKRLGFKVTSRAVALHYVSPGGGPVTQVEMERAIS